MTRPSPTTRPVADTDGFHTRIWKATSEQCPSFAQRQIVNIGLADAGPGFARVRPSPSGSYVLASLRGAGFMLLEGKWEPTLPGRVYLAPPRVPNIFCVPPGSRWEFVWVRYAEPASHSPVIAAGSPVQTTSDPEPFHLAIMGIRRELETSADPRLLHHWIEILHGQVSRSAQPWKAHPRLWKLWQRIESSLHEEWTLTSIAAAAHLSGEHLRRLCLQELGRSPIEHLSWLRAQEAARLLETTDDKVETIAAAVGYADALSFSRTFKRLMGSPPSTFRSRPPTA